MSKAKEESSLYNRTFGPLEDYSCTINACQRWQEGGPESLSPDMSSVLGYIR